MMCEGNAAATVTTPASSHLVDVSDETNVHQQQPPPPLHENPITAGTNDHDIAGWDVVAPLRSLELNTTSTSTGSGAMVWDDISTRNGKLQYRMSPQHMGTLTIPNDFVSTTRNSVVVPTTTTTTTTNTTDTTHRQSPPPTTTISTNPILMTTRTSNASNHTNRNHTTKATSYLVAGCHNGTICLWNLMHLPVLHLQQRTTATSADVAVTATNITNVEPNNNHTNINDHTATDIDPIHAIDTLTSMTPCHILDIATTAATKLFVDGNNNNSSSSSGSNTGSDNPTPDPTAASTTLPMTTTIVQVCRISDHCLAAITIIGIVYIIHITNSTTIAAATTTTTSNITTEPEDIITTSDNFGYGRMEIQTLWSTGRIGPTCLMTTTTTCDPNDDDPIVLMIGYQSGYIESWSLISSIRKWNKTQQPDESLTFERQPKQSYVWTRSNHVPQLQWRGNFTTGNDNSGSIPMIADMALLLRTEQSVPLPSQSQQQTSNQKPTDDVRIEMKRSGECIVITLHNDGHQRPDTSAMVEVIDVATILSSWKLLLLQQQSVADEHSKGTNVTLSLSLDELIVLPEAGREIINVYPNHHQPTMHSTSSNWIQSRGTNCLLSTSIPLMKEQDDTNVVVVGHADGRITFLDLSTTTNSTDESMVNCCWGVSTAYNRYCLSYPCIGIGRIDIADIADTNDDDTTTTKSYVVCCLRGSTTYLIPLQSSLSHDKSVFALPIPYDMDNDIGDRTLIRYIQGFTAGNIVVNRRHNEDTQPLNDSDNSIPILVYVSPGGLIDIYCCGLLPHQHVSAEYQLLQELITNGSVDAWRDLIVSSHHDNDTMTNPKWTNVFMEIRRHGEVNPIGMDDILSDTFTSFRSELLKIIH